MKSAMKKLLQKMSDESWKWAQCVSWSMVINASLQRSHGQCFQAVWGNDCPKKCSESDLTTYIFAAEYQIKVIYAGYQSFRIQLQITDYSAFRGKLSNELQCLSHVGLCYINASCSLISLLNLTVLSSSLRGTSHVMKTLFLSRLPVNIYQKATGHYKGIFDKNKIEIYAFRCQD